MDGATGVDLMAHLLAFTPDSDPIPVPHQECSEQATDMPGGLQSLLEATFNRLSGPTRPVRAGWRTAGGVIRSAASAISRRGEHTETAGPFAAPRTPLNGTLSPRRTVAFDHVCLDAVRATKEALGVTVNDVVLAACTLGLRRTLRTQGVRLDRPLVASVPVSVHGQTADESTNQVSNMFVHLPVHLDDPLDITARVHAVAHAAKAVQADLGPDVLGDLVDLIPPPIFHAGAELWSRSGLADRLPPIQNLVVSNVPGSPVPLYMAGAEVVGLYPFGPLIEGSGLNITVLSHMDRLQVGVIACPDLVDDVWGVTEAITEGFIELHRAACVTASPRNENYS